MLDALYDLVMAENQLDLPFEYIDIDLHPQLMSPREIWVRLSPALITLINEDRRLERKSTKKIDFEDIAEYYSCFSNTPEGGVLLFGVEDDGTISGCASLSQKR
jgi:ATP-dependent DNA helicase RecG